MLLFKRILNFSQTETGEREKRDAKRYPVGALFPLKAKITFAARDGEGNIRPGSSMDWGGQLINLSGTGASIRLHPAALALSGEACSLQLELDHRLFELAATVIHFRNGQQYVNCGVRLNFPDPQTQKAFLQLMEPVAIGSSLAPATGKVKQDLPGLIKEQYAGESESVLNFWRDGTANRPKLFELLVHDFVIRGNTEMPGLKIAYRDGAKSAKRASRPAIPLQMSAEHQEEVRRLFRFIVQNLAKGVPSELKKFLELFAA